MHSNHLLCQGGSVLSSDRDQIPVKPIRLAQETYHRLVVFLEKHTVIRSLSGTRSCVCFWAVAIVCLQFLCLAGHMQAQDASPRAFYIDCSAAINGDGSIAHPWNGLPASEAHPFGPGDEVALARGTVCHGSIAPQGSGIDGRVIRLTAYGKGPRPRIIAPASARQILLLSNQEYWQIDSLDLSGASTYGVYVTGNKGPLRHIYLKNLYVHDVHGGPLKNKDNGLIVVGPSGPATVFDDVLVDGVDAAHTNQWSGILVGGGPFAFPEGAPLNSHVRIVNSTVHDVYGDGIILFRDADSSIRTSAAWETGMQPTQDVGTPNAIWTWTCNRCTVENNEAFLTDSPGVDGGAYDIDWDNTDNTVQRNYAHDTQGYCIAVFGAGYVTSKSRVRNNLCIDNSVSPRMAATEGAIEIYTWNGGTLRDVEFRGNTILWNPRVPGTPPIVCNASVSGPPIVFVNNTIESTSPLIYHIDRPFASAGNIFKLNGAPLFTVGDEQAVTLERMQSAGMEMGSSVMPLKAVTHASSAQAIATINPALDSDGLLADDPREQLLLLRSFGGQYGHDRFYITVHLPRTAPSQAEANALSDLEEAYPGVLHYMHDVDPGASALSAGRLHIVLSDGTPILNVDGFFDVPSLGLAIRTHLGPPDYSHMQPLEQPEGRP